MDRLESHAGREGRELRRAGQPADVVLWFRIKPLKHKPPVNNTVLGPTAPAAEGGAELSRAAKRERVELLFCVRESSLNPIGYTHG